jgi:hypothetical protein
MGWADHVARTEPGYPVHRPPRSCFERVVGCDLIPTGAYRGNGDSSQLCGAWPSLVESTRAFVKAAVGVLMAGVATAGGCGGRSEMSPAQAFPGGPSAGCGVADDPCGAYDPQDRVPSAYMVRGALDVATDRFRARV